MIPFHLSVLHDLYQLCIVKRRSKLLQVVARCACTVYFDTPDIGSDLSFLQKAGSRGEAAAGHGDRRVGSVDFVLRSSSIGEPYGRFG